jgi:hypothetical protein
MSNSSESEVSLEREAVPNGLLQRLRTAKWAPALQEHLAQEIAFMPPPGVMGDVETDFAGDDADGDGE